MAASTICGTVVDASGNPVMGARVYVVTAPGAVPDVAALTGADGRFTLSAARPGTYEIACQADARGSAAATVEVGASGATAELRLRKA
jgi:protocatechuate 3,4-dioxygenase beta subunit